MPKVDKMSVGETGLVKVWNRDNLVGASTRILVFRNKCKFFAKSDKIKQQNQLLITKDMTIRFYFGYNIY
jgi:hypothetical protein